MALPLEMKNEQILYYQKRAEEYDLVYTKPERQKDLALLKAYLGKQFRNCSIAEIACGTGYWTAVLAESAQSILASDINLKMLQIAQQKNALKSNVTFELRDIEDLKHMWGGFEGLFGGFIWSHIKKEALPGFIAMALQQVREGSEVIFIDNRYVSGSNSPITRKDKNGNTLQTRMLQSGERYEIVKNFPDPKETQEMLCEFAEEIQWIDFEYYWVLKFRKRKNAG